MEARPLLVEVAAQLRAKHLDAVLIGNAAAALQGVAVLDILEKTREEASASQPKGRARRRRT